MSKYVPYKDVAMLALSSMSLLNSEWQLTIQGLPTINIVRCGECKLGGTEDCPMDEIYSENFCSYGERIE